MSSGVKMIGKSRRSAEWSRCMDVQLAVEYTGRVSVLITVPSGGLATSW
ncbi:hypothetical protein OAM67_01790 [bacterium]|nr:hypothetical protein [bacterium]